MEMGDKENRETSTLMEYDRRPLETLLRIVPAALCVSALVLMLKNKGSNQNETIEYSNVGAFRYLAYANGICGGFSVLTAFIAAIGWSWSCSSLRAWIVFFLDQLLTYVMVAAGSMAAAVLYLAKEGDVTVTWLEACSRYEGFCNRATLSIIISFVAVLCFVMLSLQSAQRLFSRYDPPNVSVHVGENGETMG